MRFLQLNFLPRSRDLGLLLLRAVTGSALLLNHGLPKILDFTDLSAKFPSILGMGQTFSLLLAILAEAVCAALVIVGWWTRLAALIIIGELSTAIIVVHHCKITPGENSGELALLYVTAMAAILIAGSGRFALEKQLHR